MAKNDIRILLIEDDLMVQEVNRQFVERVKGFSIVGAAATGTEGLNKARELKPDLIMLDIFMPGLDGVETLGQLRKEQLDIDVIVISAANDLRTIQKMLQNGAVDYIMKPFKFERVKQALDNYRTMRQKLDQDGEISQGELDKLLHGKHVHTADKLEELPKGLQAVTLKQIMLLMMNRLEPLSADEVAEGVGIARVTARRYLDYLEKTDQVKLDLQYGVGRPVNKYLWIKK